jgi:ornithine carbamoyltransferase
MAVTLKGRHFVSVKDFNREELWQVLQTALQLKLGWLRGDRPQLMAGKTLAMIFQKPSLRTRVSFEAGMTRLGGHAIYLAPDDIRLGHRETVEDVALVLSRMADVIMARVFGHDAVEELARYATVPVINGLSDLEHPCQTLADLLTIYEKRGRLEGLRAVFSGDGNNVAHSLLYGAALTGMHLTVVTPKGYEPDKELFEDARWLAAGTGAKLTVTNDLPSAVKDADVIYTDVWASMGQEAEADQRKEKFARYQVNAEVMAAADPQAIILHCLPAHYGEEIDYDTSRTSNCVMFDQAENRLHAQNGLLVLLAGG